MEPSHEELRPLTQMLLAPRLSQALYTVARLGVADLLAAGPREGKELAEATGTDLDALRRVLRCLCGQGIFTEVSPNRFGLTEQGRLLRSDVPDSLHPLAVWYGTVGYSVFGGMEYTVRTGKPAFDHIFGSEFFDFLANNPEVSATFDAFMARQTVPVAKALVRAYDFTSEDVIVDIGGGRGDLVAEILDGTEHPRALLFDLDHVLQGAQEHLASRDLLDRCDLVPGDMHAGIPAGGSVYILKSIVHALDDDAAVGLLGRVRRAMASEATLLLVECVVPEEERPHPARLLDLVTLLGTSGGRERTAGEYRELLTRAGFDLVRSSDMEVLWSVLEAAPTHHPDREVSAVAAGELRTRL